MEGNLRLSDNIVDSAKKAFSFFDGNVATYEQLEFFFRIMGEDPAKEDFDILLAHKEKTEQDTFTFDESIEMFRIYTGILPLSVPQEVDAEPIGFTRRTKKTIRDIAILFRSHLDPSGTGYITKEQLIEVLTKPNESFEYSDRMNSEEVESLLQEFKVENGKVDYVEFISSILNVD